MGGRTLLVLLAVTTVALILGGCRAGRRRAGDPNRARSPDERALSRQELLGKRLFEDRTLSEPRGVSCASCHDPARAFQGSNDGAPAQSAARSPHDEALAPVARGSRAGTRGTRNSPSLLYAAYAPPFSLVMTGKENAASKFVYAPVGGLFWDGRADTLAEQAKEPILGAREMNVPSPAAFVAKVARAPYAKLAREVLGAVATDPDRAFDALAEALAAFERSARFHPFRSKFDDYLRGAAPLSDAEARGFALFKDPYKGNCLSCHAGKVDSRRPEDWLFTDFTYSPLGVPRNAAIAENADKAYFDLGLCKRPKLAGLLPPGVDPKAYCGSFRVPSLRNVAVTAPYMHNGVFADLRDVVRFYVTRDTDVALWYPTDAHYFVAQFDLPFPLRALVSTDEVPYDRDPGQTPRLDGGEIDDVVAFLETLTDR